MGKSLFSSPRFWFAVLLVVTGVADFFGFAEFSRGPELGGSILAIIGVVVGLLRYVTKEPIAH